MSNHMDDTCIICNEALDDMMRPVGVCIRHLRCPTCLDTMILVLDLNGTRVICERCRMAKNPTPNMYEAPFDKYHRALRGALLRFAVGITRAPTDETRRYHELTQALRVLCANAIVKQPDYMKYPLVRADDVLALPGVDQDG